MTTVKHTENDVVLRLSGDEALVLFEWMHKRDKEDEESRIDAEKIVLWRLEAQLDEVLLAPFESNYDQLVEAARARIAESAGE